MKNFNNDVSFKELMIHTSISLKNNTIQKTIVASSINKKEVPLDKHNGQECVNCRVF